MNYPAAERGVSMVTDGLTRQLIDMFRRRAAGNEPNVDSTTPAYSPSLQLQTAST